MKDGVRRPSSSRTSFSAQPYAKNLRKNNDFLVLLKIIWEKIFQRVRKG